LFDRPKPTAGCSANRRRRRRRFTCNIRNAYRILVRKLDANPSGPNAREMPCYIIQVYFILTSIIYSEMMRMCGVASEKMEDFTVASMRMSHFVSFVMLNVQICFVSGVC
jgi:hypothetical protein